MCCVLELKNSESSVDTCQVYGKVKYEANEDQKHEQNQVDGSHDLLTGQLKVIMKGVPRSVFLSMADFVISQDARQYQSATIKSVNSYTHFPVLIFDYTIWCALMECRFQFNWLL